MWCDDRSDGGMNLANQAGEVADAAVISDVSSDVSEELR